MYMSVISLWIVATFNRLSYIDYVGNILLMYIFNVLLLRSGYQEIMNHLVSLVRCKETYRMWIVAELLMLSWLQ